MAILTFDQIGNLSVFHEFYQLVWRLFGVNIALVSPDGQRTVVIGSPETITRFCTAVQQEPACRARCIGCDQSHISIVQKQRRALGYRCWAGLRDFLIPIALDGETLAYLQCGQVMDAPPTAEDWTQTSQALRAMGVDKAALLAHFNAVRVIPPQTQKDLIALLELFGNYIAYAQHQLLLAEAPRRSQIAERALSYIRNHMAEPIALDDVAVAACTSKRNLTRVFEEELGLTVVQFIHETRIGQACSQLRSTDKPCTEIAFECGFGSVQQFNRIFLRAKKCTPQQWRKQESHAAD